MKTRRNGGAPSLFGMFSRKPAPAQAMPVATPEQAMTVATPAQVLTAPTPSEKRSGSIAVDNAVNNLYHLEPQFQNYHMRGIINAIGVCNSSEKAGNNLTGTFEVSECGPACKARSEKVKAALTELLRIGKDNDALGYIGSGRVAANSAGYLLNSGMSLGRKVGLVSPKGPATPVNGGRRRTRRR